MEKYINLKFISFLLIVLFSLNIFSSTLSLCKEKISVKTSSFEQIFSALNMPSKVLSNILKNKIGNTANNKQNNKQNENKTVKTNEYLLPVLNSIVFSGIYFYNSLSKIIEYGYFLIKVVEYPLKIPFWLSIFLLLIIKILFNVLPRSISINYNIKHIERACIV